MAGVSGSSLNELTNLLDSGHNSGKGHRYDTLTEKQLAAVYHTLLAKEPITGMAPIKVITTYPILAWVRDWTQKPRRVWHRCPHWPSKVLTYSSIVPSLVAP